MAGTGRILASIYRIGNYDFPGVTGRSQNLPGSSYQVYPAPLGITVNGITMQSVIKPLPTGLQVPGIPDKTMYAAADVATIQAAST